MRVAIDISQVVYGTGVSVYTANLIESLLGMDKENKYEYLLYGGALRRKKDIQVFFEELKKYNFDRRIAPIPPTLANLLWNRLHVFKFENLTGKIDVFHSSDWAQPPSRAFKVTTVHDLVPIKYPELSDAGLVKVQRSRLRWVTKEVDRIIVPSKATADDLEDFGVDSSRVRVIHEAVDPRIRRSAGKAIESMKKKYRITGNYLLAIGLTPRKNTKRIIEAFEKIKVDTNLKLVIVGHPYMDIDLPRGVMSVGHIPRKVLQDFYSGAEALVYPSLYEGFGLPILEALECKIPVVTSNIGSMAEVGEKLAILVDPYDVDSIAEGVMEAIRNREKYTKLASKHLGLFSWDKVAKETLKVYMESGKD